MKAVMQFRGSRDFITRVHTQPRYAAQQFHSQAKSRPGVLFFRDEYFRAPHEDIIAVLQSAGSDIHTVDFSNMGLTQPSKINPYGYYPAEVKAIASAIKPPCKRVSFKSSGIGQYGVASLIPIIQALYPGIEELDFESSGISFAHISDAMSFFDTVQRFKKVNISRNPLLQLCKKTDESITDHEKRVLAYIANLPPGVQTINWSDLHLLPLGPRIFELMAVCHPDHITGYDLSFMQVLGWSPQFGHAGNLKTDPTGVDHFCNFLTALGKRENVRKLSLFHTQLYWTFFAEGTTRILAAIPKTIEELNLGDNFFSISHKERYAMLLNGLKLIKAPIRRLALHGRNFQEPAPVENFIEILRTLRQYPHLEAVGLPTNLLEVQKWNNRDLEKLFDEFPTLKPENRSSAMRLVWLPKIDKNFQASKSRNPKPSM